MRVGQIPDAFEEARRREIRETGVEDHGGHLVPVGLQHRLQRGQVVIGEGQRVGAETGGHPSVVADERPLVMPAAVAAVGHLLAPGMGAGDAHGRRGDLRPAFEEAHLLRAGHGGHDSLGSRHLHLGQQAH